MKGLELLCCEEKQRAGSVQPGDFTAWRRGGVGEEVSSTALSTRREGTKETSKAPFSGSLCQYKRQWAQSGAQEVLSEYSLLHK